jgi:sarcosine oxidase subunit alpha
VTRLPPQPGERIDRDRRVEFTFDGKPVTGYAGDTIVSALYAAGRRTFSRSFKYHRPRGELCGCGQCSSSLVQVGDRPGVRACSELVVPGMAVEHQNALPGLDFDVMRATDVVGGPFTPPGFYYKTFIRPRRLWPFYEKVLRSVAGLGRLPKRPRAHRAWRTEYRRRHCDVLVIGGGIAGLAAALRAAELGADVVLCDDDVEPGGALLAEGGHEQARALAARARAAGVEVLSRASALGFYDGLVPVWQGDTLHQVRAARHVAATGTIEQPLVFPDNDLPGVMLAGGARRLATLYAVKPGEAAVVATTNDAGLDAALALHRAGVRVLAVADLRPAAGDDARGGGAWAAGEEADGGGVPAGGEEGGAVGAGEAVHGGGASLVEELRRAGIEVLHETTVVRARGRQRVTGAVLGHVDARGVADPASLRELECDLVAVSGGHAPATSLLLQGGAKARYDEATARFVAERLHEQVLVAGAVGGWESARAAELSGRVAGAEAAIALGFGEAAARAGLRDDRAELAGCPPPPPVAAPPAYARDGKRGGKAFVDLDEDQTVKDIAYAAAEGYDSIELSKRYTTVTMGPSQGRFSQLPAIRALGAHTGLTPGEVSMTTARPPWVAVPMGALAGRPFEPAKRSAIHGRQREQGAHVRWAGDWRRAYDYGDPRAEALAVHESAGVIDVSTLGKLLVRGPDAGELLDRLYPNRLSNLRPGRIRYGVMTSDAGRIIDDGTICRLDEESFYVTTTSSGAGAIEEWFGWWLATWSLDARVTDITQGLAAINLAGPRAREILAGLTDLDVSADGFVYLDGKQAAVAGVEALLMRIGFVGEVGYEIHFPACYGEHLWDTLVAAGARPFGLEPQRVLRLQKLHVIVGQDTDSESTPFGAAMPWIVKLDKKQDFIGRWALEHASDKRAELALVGFTMADGHVPTEGAVVRDENGGPLGQVTSARHSAQLGRAIGMAWVPAALAEDGAAITICDGSRDYAATVTTRPFYDPDGEVLRS